MIQIRAIGLNIKHVNDVRHQLNITKLNDPHFLSPLAKQIKQADHVIMFRHGHGMPVLPCGCLHGSRAHCGESAAEDLLGELFDEPRQKVKRKVPITAPGTRFVPITSDNHDGIYMDIW